MQAKTAKEWLPLFVQISPLTPGGGATFGVRWPFGEPTKILIIYFHLFVECCQILPTKLIVLYTEDEI